MEWISKIVSLIWAGQAEALSAPRSKEWKNVRTKHLEMFPVCEACGSRKSVVPHHIVPFHVNPSLELDLNNLVSLCESPTFNCHLFFGHLKRWDRHNPSVVHDAKNWRSRIDQADKADQGMNKTVPDGM